MASLKNEVGRTLQGVAQGIESGSFGSKIRVGLTVLGSEHGTEELIKAARIAKDRFRDFEIVLIGCEKEEGFECHQASDLTGCHKTMEELLESGKIDGCVTLHYSFPLGVSTVGKVITPGMGKEMILSTTTGTAHPLRGAAMVKNTLYGMALAKSLGIEKPTVGILNVDSASLIQRGLEKLRAGGFDLTFAESARADGGALMRGNDLLQGTPDVMVADTLTGNLLVKMFASFTTGGGYEAVGFGYGPCLGKEYPHLVSIISRASGAPVIANCLKLTADAARGNLKTIYLDMLASAEKAGLDEVLESFQPRAAAKEDAPEVKEPPAKIANEEIMGIDILEIEEARNHLWSHSIYAKSGMGCTGPVVMVADEDAEKAKELLKEGGFL